MRNQLKQKALPSAEKTTLKEVNDCRKNYFSIHTLILVMTWCCLSAGLHAAQPVTQSAAMLPDIGVLCITGDAEGYGHHRKFKPIIYLSQYNHYYHMSRPAVAMLSGSRVLNFPKNTN